MLSWIHVHMQTRAPLPLSICSWLADTLACVDHAQPATPTTDNLASPTPVVLIIVQILTLPTRFSALGWKAFCRGSAGNTRRPEGDRLRSLTDATCERLLVGNINGRATSRHEPAHNKAVGDSRRRPRAVQFSGAACVRVAANNSLRRRFQTRIRIWPVI